MSATERYRARDDASISVNSRSTAQLRSSSRGINDCWNIFSFPRCIRHTNSSSLFVPDLKYSDSETDHRRPEGEEEQKSRTDRIRVGVRPQAHLGKKNDTEERPSADHEQPEADFHELILVVFLPDHASSILADGG